MGGTGIERLVRRFYDELWNFTARDGRLSEVWVLGDLDGLRRRLAQAAER